MNAIDLGLRCRWEKLVALLVPCLLCACAGASLTESGRLSSYAGLTPSDGVMTKTKVRVEKPAVLAARTVRLEPTTVADGARASGLTNRQLDLVSNAIDRSICRNLSRRFTVVGPGQAADLEVHAVVTNVGKTDTTAAGASVVANVGGAVVGAATGVPAPVPRVPIGMGSLSVEAEARTRGGRQVAALVWARGADAFLTKARVAPEGDAHTLANAFAEDFAKLILTGNDPIADPAPMLPTAQGVGEYFGRSPKHDACKAFGRHPGIADTIGGAIGLPPAWTDDGAAVGNR